MTKNENSSKLPFAEEFSEMGWGQSVISLAVVRETSHMDMGWVGGCRLVGKLSGKSAFVGNER